MSMYAHFKDKAVTTGTRADKRIQVLLAAEEADLFDLYCRKHGFKKSTLIVRLIREHLAREGFPEQGGLFSTERTASRQDRGLDS